jgi:hypothetical protein
MLEVVRIVAGWLEDESTGVNALLPSVPRDGDDPQPDDVTVLNEADDNIPATGRLPLEVVPALVVHHTGVRWAEEQPVAGAIRDGEVDVLIRYQTADVETAAAWATTSYVLRAVERCLRGHVYGLQETMNEVTVYQITSLGRARIDAAMEDTIVTSGVTVTLRIRDGAPS